MNKNLLFWGIVITFIIIIFLYEKFKKYTDYLSIVPNSYVTTKISAKTYYRINNNSLTYAVFPNSLTKAVTTNYTSTDWPGIGNELINRTDNLITNMQGLYIYNVGPSEFKIIGISLIAFAKNNTTDKIGKTIGTYGLTSKPYDGNIVSIQEQDQIGFNNFTNFALNRITIICNNASPRSLNIYFKKSNNLCGGVTIDKLTNDILVVDFYDSPP